METQIDDIEVSLISKIEALDSELYSLYDNNLDSDINLTRKLVSFQANKKLRNYKWYKYKEGFSKDLVHYYMNIIEPNKHTNVFDPFAGSGTTLFAASEKGYNSIGIELLPIGCEIVDTRIILNSATKEDFDRLKYYCKELPWVQNTHQRDYVEIKITEGAYPEETSLLIKKYLDIIQKENYKVNKILFFALLCILEPISYTRKDGQYLRWDHRANRKVGKNPFNKGKILDFNFAIKAKIEEIIEDSTYGKSFLKSGNVKDIIGDIELVRGSVLDEINNISTRSVDIVITSPPYANRYDYTRTYALELAMLGIDSKSIVDLRQAMLSCTVENKEKDLVRLNPKWNNVISILEDNNLLQSILTFLNYKKKNGSLNNNGIPGMLKGYFYELSCVIFELFRIVKLGGAVVMVNDNVRYAGVNISVDLILSDIASKIGFEIEKIAVLPTGKGNSSQQMATHGRCSLRKCVYIWRKQ